MRVKLASQNRRRLFRAVSQKMNNWQNIAGHLRVSARTLRAWRSGKSSMPLSAFKKLTLFANIAIEGLAPRKLPNFWHIKKAARQGAYARMMLYGPPGTPAGRKRGGQAAMSILKRKHVTRFKLLKSIRKPPRSAHLAELMGILTGDGHLSEYQISVYTNSKTDMDHAWYVQKLIKKLFGVKAKMREKEYENTVVTVASSKNLADFLRRNGMPIGNKLQNGLAAPGWIWKKVKYQKAFIRGLFDTDGCVYMDKHVYRKKNYKYLGWTITSYADSLIEDIKAILQGLGFAPTHRPSQKSVSLRRQQEIDRYFQEISTHNIKHLKRYRLFRNSQVH